MANNSRLVLYDDEQGLAAARAYMTFDYLGLGEQTALLDGQLVKWQSENLPLATGGASKLPATVPANMAYLPRLRPHTVITMDQVRDATWAKNNLIKGKVSLVDARPLSEYSGTTAGVGIARPGHIPAAVNVDWRLNLLSLDMPVFAPPSTLRKIYAAAGVINDDLVITYCRTGGHACMNYFVLKYMGYDVRLFDGSYEQWSRARDTLVATGEDPSETADGDLTPTTMPTVAAP